MSEELGTRKRLSLAAVRDLLFPAVLVTADTAARKYGIPIRSADLRIDFLTDELHLVVEHKLLSGGELTTDNWKGYVAHRLNAAMRLFHRMPAAKALCVDRRRLQARGEKARKNTARPTGRR